MPSPQSELFDKNTHGYDLHTHSNASDGTLTPQALIQTALDCGLTHLALSDHDTLAGYRVAKDYLRQNNKTLTLIPAVEFSSRWNTDATDQGRGMTVHIVALNIDPEHTKLHKLITATQQARAERNQRLQRKLIKKGWADVYALALELTQGGQLTRTHMARAMLQLDKVSSYKQAFSRYLGSGKPLAVHTQWPNLHETISHIKLAGGTAVLAHPLHYGLTRKKLLSLCTDFKLAGGEALEVITGRADKKAIDNLTGIALRQNLAASVGSDFHAPDKGVSRLGVTQSLADTLTPVWAIWQKTPDTKKLKTLVNTYKNIGL